MFDFKQIFNLRTGVLPVLLVAFIAGCGGGGGGGGLDPILGTPGASARPTVTATTPVASAPVVTGVALNSVVSAAFSKDMAPDSLSGSSFTLSCPAASPVRAAVTYNPATRVATLTPEAALPPAALCVATVTTAARDTLGLALATDFVWGFMTGPAPDLTPPTVVATVPAAGATGVVNNTLVTAVFSEDMRAASINSTSFTLVNNGLGTAVPGTVSYSATGRTAVFTPSAPGTLAPNTSFTATITTGAADLAGNTMAARFVWTFTTAALPDTIRPTIVLTVPAPGATAVANNTAITATFSEDMNPASISATNFTLVNTALGTAVPGTVTYSAIARTAVFTPSTPATLAANTGFTATITNAAADLAGNTLAAHFVWNFTTAAAADTTRPTVIATVPAGTATGVANNTAISASFSEDMNPLSISGSSFTVVNTTLGRAVPGTVSYAPTGRTAVFTPSNPATLAPNTAFTATITNAAADLAGNTLAANFVWTFTTAAAGDSTRPTVIATVPAANATGVANNTAITATFSEDMNPASLSVASFTVVNNTLGTAVAGTVSYAPTGRTAIFTPTNPATLPAGNSFRAMITTGAADLAGNELAANHFWNFSTAAAPVGDTSRPIVVSTVPGNGATAVSTNTAVTATFSEDMNPTSITSTSFTLLDNSTGTAVAGIVSYSVPSRTATFTPANGALLAVNSDFTARITTAATDLAGIALGGNTAQAPNAGDHVWTFSTRVVGGGGGGDTVPPTVTAVSPLDGSTGVCRGTAVSATFNEAMAANTLNNTTFTVTDAGVPVVGNVSYDVQTRVASFVPTAVDGFAASRLFVVTVRSGNTGVKDLAGNPLAADRVWSFSTGTQACANAVNLRTASVFAVFGGNAGVTNQGVNTVVGGDLGSTAVCTAITGFHDANNVYTQTLLNVGAVNGVVVCAPPAPGTIASLAIATQARADAQTAYNDLAALPAGSDPGAGQLGGQVLPGGVYTAAGNNFAITTGNLTLDGQGNANAIWVFQMGAALTVGQPALPRQVLLINGAQASNVFWQVGSAARIEDGSVMVGTIIASAGVTISTAGQTAQTTLNGRALSLIASVTMVNTTVVAP